MTQILFLDIDGVLNAHQYDPKAESCVILPECVYRFNTLLDALPDLNLVISSAWRYMIRNGAMSLSGFEYLLRTHGLYCKNRIVDCTGSDEACPRCSTTQVSSFNENGYRECLSCKIEITRGEQTKHWLTWNLGVDKYLVLDDEDLGFSKLGLSFLKTNSTVGLTLDDVRKIIDYFNEK